METKAQCTRNVNWISINSNWSCDDNKFVNVSDQRFIGNLSIRNMFFRAEYIVVFL